MSAVLEARGVGRAQKGSDALRRVAAEGTRAAEGRGAWGGRLALGLEGVLQLVLFVLLLPGELCLELPSTSFLGVLLHLEFVLQLGLEHRALILQPLLRLRLLPPPPLLRVRELAHVIGDRLVESARVLLAQQLHARFLGNQEARLAVYVRRVTGRSAPKLEPERGFMSGVRE